MHHSTAYDDTFYKYSPGKALILTIGEWMNKNGLNILDFGEGAESYKYAYTNKELELNEITISALKNVPFILKVKLRQIMREQISENPKLIKFYKEKIKGISPKAQDTSNGQQEDTTEAPTKKTT